MNKKSLSQLNSRQKRKMRLKRLIALFSAIAVFVTTYALILPAITIDDETAENEPGLDVVQVDEETVDTEELVPPPSEPGEPVDDVSRSASCGDLTVGAELTDGSFGESVVMELTAVSDESILNAMVQMAEAQGVKNAKIMWPVRIAAAGKAVTPGGAVEICRILGREETLRRLRIGLEKLS